MVVEVIYNKYTFISDYSKGFGGKYGIQTDRQDKAALGFDYKEKVEKHASQKGRVTSVQCKEWKFSKKNLLYSDAL